MRARLENGRLLIDDGRRWRAAKSALMFLVELLGTLLVAGAFWLWWVGTN